MRPETVKAKLTMRRIKMKDIAAEAGCSPAAVTLVIQRRGMSRRLRGIIAEKLGFEYDKVWGAVA